ncbi:virulence factor [Yersinia kristensenii ATCC 33638]|nr:virulence factor [Yersinia kristensenii ATCC 33638]
MISFYVQTDGMLARIVNPINRLINALSHLLKLAIELSVI